MDLKPGDVVILKSGGHPLSVVEVNDGKVVCVWMGNEGDLFRETLPLAVLELAEPDTTTMKTKTKKKTTKTRRRRRRGRASDGKNAERSFGVARHPRPGDVVCLELDPMRRI